MSNLAKLAFEFEGTRAHVYVFRGRACMIGPDLGAGLRYTREGFTKTVDRWQKAEELIEGVDYDVLRGKDLAEFRELVGVDVISTSTPQLMIFYERGLWQVCQNTKKPLGKALRRMLSTDVLPKLARGEGIPATKAAPAASPLPASAMTPELVVYFEAKARLESALARGEITESYFDAKLAEHLVRAGGLDYTAAPKRLGFERFVDPMRGLAANETLELKQDGKFVARAHGLVDPGECATASEVARRFAAGDVRANPAQVNDLARALGIFGDEAGGWGAWYTTELTLTTAKGPASKNWLHSPKAIERLGPYVADVARGGQKRLLELVRELNPAYADQLDAKRLKANETRRQTNAARKTAGHAPGAV